VDDEMMDEIKRLHAAIKPIETLFVVDSMTGQDAANTAKAFDDALPLTGVILTKTDGDARGGAALSIRHITGKPIKFMGVGEKTAALEVFHPDRIASRILGMGDVLSLIEDVERKMDREKAEKLAKKIHKGRAFDLNDYRDQLLQIKNMGGMMALLDKMPGVASMPKDMKEKINDKEMIQQLAIIDSMTPQERKSVDVINNSRKRRIALGSGTDVADINRMLKQHDQMQKMMKKLKGGNIANLMRGMKGAFGNMRRPPF
jgi:signal recognition particle subunit SRP54